MTHRARPDPEPAVTAPGPATASEALRRRAARGAMVVDAARARAGRRPAMRGPAAGMARAGGAGGGPALAAGRPGERGAALVELVVVMLTLLVPLVYVMLVMADVQRALLATSSAAREAGRVYVTGSDRLDAERRAGLAYREVLATYGVRAGDPRAGMRLRSGCPAGVGAGVGAGCVGGFGPGAEVEVVVTYRVPVARVPFLGAVAGPSLTVGATHHTRVDRYRGLGR